jgi:hypothetical protein
VAVVAGHLDQLFHFTVGQVLPGPPIGVFSPPRLNCSILVVGATSRRFAFAMIATLPSVPTVH